MKFLFFAGKGGVGKTTCGAARAVHEARSGRHVLVVSTDPAHSLGDALGVRLSGRVSRVALKARGSLDAVELDAGRAFAQWLEHHRQALGDILEQGSWLDRSDVDAFIGLPVPGVDELLAMLEIVRLSRPRRRRGYDLVVVDTAPTGHTLRLLAAPDAVGAVAEALESLRRDRRAIRERFAGVHHPEAADRLVALLAHQAEDTRRLVRDARRCEFHWVTAPEALSLAETGDGLRALRAAGIRVAEVVVNRVVPEGPACRLCDRRRAAEGQALAEIARVEGRRLPVRLVPAEPLEPRGLRRLEAFGKRLTASVPPRRPGGSGGRRAADATVFSSLKKPKRLSIDVFLGMRLIFFGGKGGVGKTTVSAACALAIARACPKSRVLLLSTDPAHSLGDLLGAPLNDTAARVRGAPPNFRARELDAAGALQARRSAIESAAEEIVEAFGVASLGSAGSPGVTELLNLAPPGIDELLGLVSVAELVGAHRPGSEGPGLADRYDTIVVDTAPTGHALRLLEMPDAARDWLQALMRMLLKYRHVVGPGRLAAELIDLSRSIRELRGVIRNRKLTAFAVVTRAAEVPRLETERLLRSLRTLRLASPWLVVNAMTLAPGRCGFCRRTAAAEKMELTRLASARGRLLRECAIIQTPLAAPPPCGAAALGEWANTWIESRTSTV